MRGNDKYLVLIDEHDTLNRLLYLRFLSELGMTVISINFEIQNSQWSLIDDSSQCKVTRRNDACLKINVFEN